jgi:large subunit ribosomal protein L16
MLYPKRTQNKKYFKGRANKQMCVRPDGIPLFFGQYALCATKSGRIRYQTIEAARRAISRHFHRCGKIWVRVFADIPVTSKPTEVRMGKGKGNPCGWFVRVAEGQILFEMNGVSQSTASSAARCASQKLNVPTQFVVWS